MIAAAEPKRARVLEWAAMTGAEIDAVDRTRAVVIVACSPLEVHGPHLPVVTDNYEAQHLAITACDRVAEDHPDLIFLRLPPIYVAADVLPHVGSLMFRQSTIIAVLEDLGRSLARQGFRHIWVSSFHGGPRHFVSIETACARVNRRYDARMVSVFSLLIGLLTGGETDLSDLFAGLPGLDADALAGDSHGGAVETSIMLHALPGSVREGHHALPRRTVDIHRAERGLPALGHPGVKPTLPRIFSGLKAKLHYYVAETYSGHPAAASKEAGAEMVQILGTRAGEALAKVWTGEIPLSACHSPVWPARWIFTSHAVSWVFERAAGYDRRIF